MSNSESILLILSDPLLGQLLKCDILQPAGYEVSILNNSADANALVRTELPDVIILNDQLENKSGLELGSKLLELYPQLSIILLPKEHSEELALDAIRRGFADYIQPPFLPNEVQQSVKRAVQRRQRLESWARLKTKRNTQSLQRERNQLETILTEIEEGVIIVDHDRRLMLANRKARSVFELGEINLTGKRVQEVIPHQELVEALTENVGTSPFRMEVVLENGLVFNAQITPIPEVGLAVTMQDISHLKELDHIKSDFVNTVSHDLRSPLTAILGYIELIDRVGPVNEQQSEFISRVQVSVHSITSLINDLLDLGRIEAGFDARKEVVPLSAIIHYAIDSLRNRIAEKSQQVILDVPEDLPQVLGNPIRLRQMASNLLNNSIKYTPEGGEISIRIKAEDRQLILQVADNGPGIPPSDQPYIFDKFYRGSNVTSEIPGSGLGLAIVKSIVDNHQGRIWVDSAVGEGTTFTVVLPVYDGEL